MHNENMVFTHSRVRLCHKKDKLEPLVRKQHAPKTIYISEKKIRHTKQAYRPHGFSFMKTTIYK